MKKIMVVLGLLVSMALISAPSQAFTASDSSAFMQDKQQTTFNFGKSSKGKKCKIFCGKKKPKKFKKRQRKSVPEMDAAGAAIALALMGGFISIMRERRKK